MAKENASIYQLKIILKDIRPGIWRRFQVRGDVRLSKLHDYIQAVMGWEDYHMHMFRSAGEEYGEPDVDDDMFGLEINDDQRYRLCNLVDKGDRFEYEYDFGDGWKHEIKVEKVLEPEAGVKYPVCIAGERACPPEDSGGPWGYEELLEALGDPEHEEYENYREWAGEDFGPEEFDVNGANALLEAAR